LIVATGLAAGADSASATKDSDRIQGSWVLVRTERDGQALEGDALKASNVRMVFEGEQVIARMGDKSASLGTFALDPSQTPKAFDRIYPDGSPRRGIYRLERDTLTICFADVRKQRPKEFGTKPGNGATLVVYKRE
jgi:uncharacterized protein (TIGR03067 family)